MNTMSLTIMKRSHLQFFSMLGLASLIIVSASLQNAMAAVGQAEKEKLKFGFIKLTDMTPLAIAYEKGYFEAPNVFSGHAVIKSDMNKLFPERWVIRLVVSHALD